MKRVIPERLKAARIQVGLSVGHVNRMLKITHDPRWVEKLENRIDLKLTDDLLKFFSTHYGVSEAWLCGEEKPLTSTPEHLDQLAKLSPEDRDRVIDFLQSIS